MEVKIFKKKIKLKTMIIILLALILLSVVIAVLILRPAKEKTCSVTFDTNGGNQIATQNVQCGTKISMVVPEKFGFTFKGWFYNDEAVNFDDLVINGDIVLTANWEKDEDIETVIVNFDSDGGSAVAPIEVAKGWSISAPISPTKKGYVFAGWYINDDLFDFTFTINEDITLKAKWQKKSGNIPINQNKPEENSNPTNVDAEIEKKVNDLKGVWYYENDPFVYFNFSYTYIGSNKAFAVNWDSYDIEKGVLYPTWSHWGGHNFYLPLNESFLSWLKEYKINLINSNELMVGKYKFTRIKKEVNLSIYDKYLGTWYLKSDADCKVEIKKEYDPLTDWTSFRINVVSKNNGEYKYTNYPAEGISYRTYNEKNTIFDRLKLKTENGNLIYNNQTYVKNKKDSVIPVLKLSVLVDNPIIEVGETAQFSLDSYPKDANDLDGTWRVEDPSVASIDQNGKLTGKKNGHIKVFYRTNNGKEEFTYIGINNATVKGVKLLEKNINLSPSRSHDLKYEITPDYATNYVVLWTSSNPKVATVDRGSITTYEEGTTTITITVKSDEKTYTDTCLVRVERIKPSSVKLSHSKIELPLHRNIALEAIVEPNDAYNKGVTWTSSAPNIASVDSKGIVTANKEGTAIITATTNEGGFTATCEVTVTFDPLKGSASWGLATVIDGSIHNDLYIQMAASGGYGYYYYSFKLYKEGNLLKEVSNSIENKFYVPLSSIPNTYLGAYRLEYTIRDTDNNEFKDVYEFTVTE